MSDAAPNAERRTPKSATALAAVLTQVLRDRLTPASGAAARKDRRQ
jgi:hypothetical protein